MSRHRLESTGRVRPRYGWVAAAGLVLAVTMVALLGFVGLIPLDPGSDAGDHTPVASGQAHRTAARTDPTPAAAPTGGPDPSRSREDRSVSHALEEVAAADPDNGMP